MTAANTDFQRVPAEIDQRNILSRRIVLSRAKAELTGGIAAPTVEDALRRYRLSYTSV